MATCPTCGDFLDDGHRCAWKVRGWRIVKSLAVAVFGGIAGAGIVLIASNADADILVLIVSAVFGGFVTFVAWKKISW
jgi:hypothetical protein